MRVTWAVVATAVTSNSVSSHLGAGWDIRPVGSNPSMVSSQDVDAECQVERTATRVR